MVEQQAFRDLTVLQKLFLNSTSIICDRDIADFLEFLAKAKPYPNARFVCAFPPELQGRRLQSLSPSQLTPYDKPRPKIARLPESRSVTVGSNVTLNCSVSLLSDSAAAGVTIRWKKDDRLMVKPETGNSTAMDQGNATVVVTSSLMLFDVDRSDSGSYQCIANNNFGTVFSSRSRIAVHVFPTFVKHPQVWRNYPKHYVKNH